MNLSSFEWLLVSTVGGVLFGIVGYFLKRTMGKTDEHDQSINSLKQDSVSKKDIKQHESDINHIKLTYVTKDELKELRGEMKELRAEMQANNKETQAELKSMMAVLNSIKDDGISKQDYHRARIEDNRKMERIQQILLERLGGD